MSCFKSVLGRLGFIGTGRIASALVDGIILRCPPAAPIIVSPRGQHAAQLLEHHGDQHVDVATSNQQVIDQADTVFLALRPSDAIEAIEKLCFRGGGRLSKAPPPLIVSLMHGVSPAAIAAASECGGGVPVEASAIVRANPLPACALGEGVTAVYPRHTAVCELFQHLGSVHPVDSMDELHVLHSASTLMGPLFELMRQASGWTTSALEKARSGDDGVVDEELESLVRQGTAEQFIVDTVRAVAAEASHARAAGHPLANLVVQQTRRGLNEANIQFLQDAGTFDVACKALGATLDKLHAANEDLGGNE